MTPGLAIVGMACQYPDARTPAELWDNVLAQRRAFRRIPDVRLNPDDYLDADRDNPDTTYAVQAALIEGYEFDRTRYRVAGATYRAADLAHWLALDVAAHALADAGFADGESLPRETTGVVLGNTLTGEFSRANNMRLRWPYVRRVTDEALAQREWSAEQRASFLEQLEVDYKSPFPAVGEETLAGGLSNTIAGRICNHFDLKGGGYTVDGACAASLLAVTSASTSLVAGDLDVALAGGVDLSLDPFELVGFAKAGALATGQMRVFDEKSSGFWPGEGSGFVVLMRLEDAIAQNRRIYAVIRGWGVSSDGSGGITRPEIKGQILAVQRAYGRAGYGADSVEYFEGHGTGTPVGDTTELHVLNEVRQQHGADGRAAIGSIKANIGHTKAAAGIAGLLKATLALHNEILPPTTGCDTPHQILRRRDSTLRVLRQAESWPEKGPRRAAVSAMGFGGINTHLTLEAPDSASIHQSRASHCRFITSAQHDELFLFSAESKAELIALLGYVRSYAERLSLSELTDVAAQLARLPRHGRWRAGLTARTPGSLSERLDTVWQKLGEERATQLSDSPEIFVGESRGEPRIGLLFPGQGSPVYFGGGIWSERFSWLRDLYGKDEIPKSGDIRSTDIAQPLIAASCITGLRFLKHLGISAQVSVGHSLGELTALHWGGGYSEAELLALVSARGRAMASADTGAGTMARIAASREDVGKLLDQTAIVIAGVNAPRQTVVSGERQAVARIVERARAAGWASTLLPISYAFHSPLLSRCIDEWLPELRSTRYHSLKGKIFSTVTGRLLPTDQDLCNHLCSQITSPVLFLEAIRAAAPACDLIFEVGPGHVLTNLASDCISVPVMPLDAGGTSLETALRAVAAAFVIGCEVQTDCLFDDRLTRPFELDWKPRFFQNPCELAPKRDPLSRDVRPGVRLLIDALDASPDPVEASPRSVIEILKSLVSQRTELPTSMIHDDDRFLSDLHLNSIVVGQLITKSAQQLGLQPPQGLTDFANVSIAKAASALEEIRERGGQPGSLTPEDQWPAGVAPWFRAFTLQLEARPLRHGDHVDVPAEWDVIAAKGDSLAGRLRERFSASISPGGVLLCLPPVPDHSRVPLFIEAVRNLYRRRDPGRFVIVQHGWGGTGFARSVHLELSELTTCVINVPVNCPEAADWIVREAAAAHGFVEAFYDRHGRRCVPILKVLPLPYCQRTPAALRPSDVALITGGAKGITAECALQLARHTGIKLAFVGRTDPRQDSGLMASLERMRAHGIECIYYQADVTDLTAVRSLVASVERDLGTPTIVLHGAGTNRPQPLQLLDEESIHQTLAAKVDGARNILSTVDSARLRYFIGFGSIIARTGLQGEADYALANEWLSHVAEEWKVDHPNCVSVVIDWSVWSGLGMGEQLGRVENLRRNGIVPIPPDEGAALFERVLSLENPPTSVVVTGRYGNPPTILPVDTSLPALRFLERPRVHHPGIEMVIDAKVSCDSDPYLEDHVLRGERLFPAVMALEAMAEVATSLATTDQIPTFFGVEFLRPIIVGPQETVTLRIAALLNENGSMDVVIRSSDSSFQIDHCRARCRFTDEAEPSESWWTPRPVLGSANDQLSRDETAGLYGTTLFQTGRFKRLSAYQLLQSRSCIADFDLAEPAPFFGHFPLSGLILGDAGARDAAIHAIQACTPHRRLVPIGADRIEVTSLPVAGGLRVHAREREQRGETIEYDLVITDTQDRAVERWTGLRLKAIDQIDTDQSWPPALLAVYLERRITEIFPGAQIGVEIHSSADRENGTGAEDAPIHRLDGKPEAASGGAISVSHRRGLTLSVVGDGPLGCDLEGVEEDERRHWNDLLGPDRLALAGVISRETGETSATAALRVWTAIECIKKAGLPAESAIVFESVTDDRWLILGNGRVQLASYKAKVYGHDAPFIATILTPRRDQERNERYREVRAQTETA